MKKSVVSNTKVLMHVAHSKKVSSIALEYGWFPGARYTNMRDVRDFEEIGLVDINWKQYDFEKHLNAVSMLKPLFTVARDIEDIHELDDILYQADKLLQHSTFVIIVPKDTRLIDIDTIIPPQYLLGYSVPTRYGGTEIPKESFKRPVHLLGGRPDVQRNLANFMPVVSFDCNRFTLDASFGDYFDGSKFRPHPTGGYENCIRDSIKNITSIWDDYFLKEEDLIGFNKLQERVFTQNV